MIARPVAVEPVNDTRSIRGSVASTEATPLSRGVTTLSTPGGRSVCSVASRPSSAATQGVSGAGLSTTVLPASSAGPDLGEVDLVREVPRRDRGDDTDGLAPDGPPGRDAHRLGHAEIGLPLVGLGEVGRPAQSLDRHVVLRAGGEERRRPDLGGGQRAHLLAVVDERLVQLAHAAHPQLEVRRPVGLVERAACCGDRGVDVLGRGVGCVADVLAGGRVEDRVRRAVARLDELAVDQEQGRLDIQGLSHRPPPGATPSRAARRSL